MQGISLNLVNDAGASALHVATYLNHGEVVKLLLKAKGIDVGVRNKKGETAAEVADQRGLKEISALFSATVAR